MEAEIVKDERTCRIVIFIMAVLRVKQRKADPPSESGSSDRWVSFNSQRCRGFHRWLCDLQQTVFGLIFAPFVLIVKPEGRQAVICFSGDPLREQAALENLFSNRC